MIKKLLPVLCITLLTCACGGQKPADTIELPLTWHEGNGPVQGRGYSYIDVSSHPMTDHLKDKVVSLPDGMAGAEVGMMILNFYQVMYQGYLAGNVPQETYDFYSKAWPDYDESKLSREHVRSYILFALGRDADGNPMVVADANANDDLSDDPVIQLVPSREENPDVTPVYVEYDRYADGKIHKVRRPMAVLNSANNGHLVFFFDYGAFEKDGKVIGVVANALREQDDYYDIIPVGNGDLETPVHERLRVGEYLAVDGEYYKILGMNGLRDRMVLEKAPAGKIYSTQVGMEAYPISGKDMATGRDISLEDYRGKYLFIDIWSRGCGPCISAMPELAQIYAMADKSKIEFLGIVEQSSPDALLSIMERQGVTWPHIMNSEDNDILGLYRVSSYPTTYLIGPDGRIVAKDLTCDFMGELWRQGVLTPDEYKAMAKEILGWEIFLEDEEPEDEN